MDINVLLVLQLLAHIAADYFFQSQRMSDEKNEYGFKSKYLGRHILIVFILSWVCSLQLQFFVAAAIIAIFHYFIDALKSSFNRNASFGKYAFFIDQGLHLLVLGLVSFLFDHYYGWDPIWELPISLKHLMIVTAFLLCLKPANIFIRECFRAAQVPMVGDDELPNAGKLIGILERILTLTFIIIGQFQAVGLLIAAKSILRYKDSETPKTEYVLIGTMLSFGVAIMLGILINSW